MGTLIGYAAAPLKPESLQPWLESFRRYCPLHRVILLADPAEAYEMLHDYYNVEIVPCNLHTDPFDIPEGSESYRGCVSVYKDRWAAIANLNLPDDEIVLLTDTRDVYFQRNPFPQISDQYISVAPEGVTYQNDPWNRMLLDRFYPELRKEFVSRPTICAGVIAGPWRLVQPFTKLVHNETLGKSGLIDQIALNVALWSRIIPFGVVHYEEGWCCHSAQMITPWAVRDATILPRTEPVPLLLNNGKVATREGKPFAIVHHWTMVPQLAEWGKAGRIL